MTALGIGWEPTAPGPRQPAGARFSALLERRRVAGAVAHDLRDPAGQVHHRGRLHAALPGVDDDVDDVVEGCLLYTSRCV